MMYSHLDLERLIAEKKLEIEKEKIVLGFAMHPTSELLNVDREEVDTSKEKARKLRFQTKNPSEDNAATIEEKKEIDKATERDLQENIPAELERYIRRYLGLPVMLKAGEYSPNNPLVRCERSSGDVLLALGEYERRRNTLRRMRQQQYREYLDQQAKKKQEAKEQAERERREREEREREREEREREREEREKEQREERDREQRERDRRLVDQERRSPERRPSVCHVNTHCFSSKKDSAVQVDSVISPLSVAVQTDDADLFQIATSKWQLTQAERELSPHTVVDPSERPIQTAAWDQAWNIRSERRRSYGDFDERSLATRKSNRDKLVSDLRHSYMPSIFDADAIQMRNLQAEKEAAARRQFYQQELKNQIMEQQRIKEERKSREKMLEQAEMRRLEEQLKMLRAAQDTEVDKQQRLDDEMKNDALDYQTKRADLQKEIDFEQQKLKVPSIQHIPKRIETSRSEDTKLPVFYPKIQERYPNQDKKPHSQDRISTYHDRIFSRQDRFSTNQDRRISDKKPFSTNIPKDSIFSPNYDVDSYLRKNLNFKDRYDFDIESIGKERTTERVLVHERPKRMDKLKVEESVDSLPIPVLKHSPVIQSDNVESGLSEAMRKVNDKWKVPAVQKNILKSMPNDEGKNVSILTQLGSIRRQLQLEQLRLDQMSKDE